MIFKNTALICTAIMSISPISHAYALDLYVDTKTQQIFAAPGEGREKLGTFVKVEDAEKPEVTTLESPQVEVAEGKEEPGPGKGVDKTKKGNIAAGVSYGKDGFEFRTENDRFSLAIQNRIQARFAEPFDSDPRTLEDLEREESSFMIRRARTKLRGHAYVPWLKYYLQYDWSQPVLRDLNLTIDKYKWAEVRVGRGTVTYNNERVTSSGAQQFVNRSIVNDRALGTM